MRILQLNVWTGRIKGALAKFLAEADFDVICLQEAVWSDRDAELRNLFVTVDQIKELTGMKYEARSANWGLRIFSGDDVMEQGNVILSREEIEEEKSWVVDGEYGLIEKLEDFYEHAYTLQMIRLTNGLTVVNHHGYWEPDPIGDERTVEVMRRVAEHLREVQRPLVMCGDLNIIHDSPAMRQLDFLRDLTNGYGVDNTLAGLKFDGKVACDHILVSPEVTVERFEVLDELASDHKALVAEVKV